jgi:hypothetical protein
MFDRDVKELLIGFAALVILRLQSSIFANELKTRPNGLDESNRHLQKSCLKAIFILVFTSLNAGAPPFQARLQDVLWLAHMPQLR